MRLRALLVASGGRSGGCDRASRGRSVGPDGAERRHGPGMERQRPRRVGRCWPAAERCGAAHGDGAGRRLRRCELDRRRARALPRRLPAASPTASMDAAIATAAYRVLDGLGRGPCRRFPTPSAPISWSSTTRRWPRSPTARRRPSAWRLERRPRRRCWTERDGDGRYVPFPLTVGTEPGEWRPIPPANAIDPNSWISEVDPFTLLSTSQFRTPGPRNLNSAAYAHEYDEVKSLGAVTARAARSRKPSPASSTSARWSCSTVRSGPSPRRRG